jgi:hypothetical protein
METFFQLREMISSENKVSSQRKAEPREIENNKALRIPFDLFYPTVSELVLHMNFPVM